MGMAFWLRRFVVIFVAAFAVIGVGQLLKGHGMEDAAKHALLWATISGSVFVAGRMYQSGRGEHCALCRDIPEMRDAGLS
ncbi:MAG: hypothetical protein ACREPE_08850 [Lysobacter sp.]